jgi:hypothetical protein
MLPIYSHYVVASGKPRLINRVLEINSCHVPLTDTEKFARWSHLVAEYQGGWLFHLDVRDDGNVMVQHETLDEAEELGLSEVFTSLLRLAWTAECFLLRIHQDGEVYADLPRFNW